VGSENRRPASSLRTSPCSPRENEKIYNQRQIRSSWEADNRGSSVSEDVFRYSEACNEPGAVAPPIRNRLAYLVRLRSRLIMYATVGSMIAHECSRVLSSTLVVFIRWEKHVIPRDLLVLLRPSIVRVCTHGLEPKLQMLGR
jgi:hypothetical protein